MTERFFISICEMADQELDGSDVLMRLAEALKLRLFTVHRLSTGLMIIAQDGAYIGQKSQF
jgi:hypothetical protein